MPKKILIVEDEANIRELLRLYLEREGYTVLEAENGVEGIKKWKSDKPDMLLLDVMMPVMDGWAVCKEIRAESDVPIIMLTAKGETADRVSGLEMGAGRLHRKAARNAGGHCPRACRVPPHRARRRTREADLRQPRYRQAGV